MLPNPKLSSTLLENSGMSPGIWGATRLTLHRNLARFRFPHKMQPSERAQSYQLLRNIFQKDALLSTALSFSESELNAADRELLSEAFCFLGSVPHPFSGSGLLVDPQSKFLALFNETDHLELQMVLPGGQTESSWKRLSALDQLFSKQEEVAFSPQFGYLTSDPAQAGTALSVYSYLHLPALIQMNQLQRLLPKENEEIQCIGLSGEAENLVGDWAILKNSYSLGVTEESILQTLQTASVKLVGAEKAQRSQLREKKDPAIKDLISKAYGLLAHAYQLELKEALAYLSLMRLGLDLGWLTGATEAQLQSLGNKIRRGHLAALFPELHEKPEELEHRRAEFLHKELQGLQLGPELV